MSRYITNRDYILSLSDEFWSRDLLKNISPELMADTSVLEKVFSIYPGDVLKYTTISDNVKVKYVSKFVSRKYPSHSCYWDDFFTRIISNKYLALIPIDCMSHEFIVQYLCKHHVDYVVDNIDDLVLKAGIAVFNCKFSPMGDDLHNILYGTELICKQYDQICNNRYIVSPNISMQLAYDLNQIVTICEILKNLRTVLKAYSDNDRGSFDIVLDPSWCDVDENIFQSDLIELFRHVFDLQHDGVYIRYCNSRFLMQFLTNNNKFLESVYNNHPDVFKHLYSTVCCASSVFSDKEQSLSVFAKLINGST